MKRGHPEFFSSKSNGHKSTFLEKVPKQTQYIYNSLYKFQVNNGNVNLV